MNRFTTDTPNGNLETMLNFAYAKNGDVWLRGADNGKDTELCAYIAKSAFYLELCGITSKDDVAEACGSADCFCELGALFAAATQAAELRARLAAYEDTGLEPEQINCVNTNVYVNWRDDVFNDSGTEQLTIDSVGFMTHDGTFYAFDEIGKTVFLTREDAEKALEGKE